MAGSSKEFKVIYKGDAYLLDGILDENAELSPLNKAVLPLKLNLSKLKRCNSIGIRTLLKFIKNWGAQPFEYQEAPVEFVNQINMIPSLLGVPTRCAQVSSFMVPYECESCDYDTEVRMTADDFFTDPQKTGRAQKCPECGNESLILADPLYFKFLNDD